MRQLYLRRAVPSIPQTKIHIFKGYQKNDAWKNVGRKNVGNTCEVYKMAYRGGLLRCLGIRSVMAWIKEYNKMHK